MTPAPLPAPLTPAETHACAWIDAQAPRLIATLQAWARINSGSRNREGLEAMRAALRPAFAPLGARMEDAPLAASPVVGSDGSLADMPHAPALRVVQRPEAPVQIALTGHYDTVFPADSPFQDCRRLDDDRLNGPGVADMKGGLLVMATALEAFERFGARAALGFTALISPDEEIGSPGSAPLLAELGVRAHAGLTFEPSLPDGRLAGARKGSGNYALVVRGRAAHAGRAHHEGRNALEALAGFVVALQGLNGARPGVTFNVGKVEGGGPVNIVPDLAIARFNVRMPGADDQAWAEAEIARLVAQTGAREGFSASLHGGVARPPKPMAPANARLFAWTKHAGASLGVPIDWADTGGVCEGNNLWAAGCPNVDTLGVVGGDIHSEREWLRLSSLAERAKLAALLLLRFGSGAYDARALRSA